MEQDAVSKDTVLSELLSVEVRLNLTVLSELLSVEVRLNQIPDLLLGFFQSTDIGEGAARRLEVNVVRSPGSSAGSDFLPRPHRQRGRYHQTQHNTPIGRA